MRTVDTDPNICVLWTLPSDIHRSMIYAYHRKYLNIVNVRQFPLLKKTSSFQKCTKGYIRPLYVFIMYICWYINCLLYVNSSSLISNMSIVLL